MNRASILEDLAATFKLRNAWLIVLFASLFAWVSTARAEDSITLTTEDYPPYNFVENGVYKGAGYDQMVLIMKDTGIHYTVELMPWARAYAMAQLNTPTCVFSTAHTPERNALFKWVEPLAVDRNVIAAKVGSGIHVDNLEQARRYRVGTQRDDYTQTFLEKNGFKEIDLASSLDLTLKKLEIGRIDLIPLSEKFFHDLVGRGHPLEQQFVMTEQIFALACSKSVPDAQIEKMQASLNKLIADGQQQAIFKRYGLMISP